MSEKKNKPVLRKFIVVSNKEPLSRGYVSELLQGESADEVIKQIDKKIDETIEDIMENRCCNSTCVFTNCFRGMFKKK